MSYFKAKMRQIRFIGLRSRPRWGSSQVALLRAEFQLLKLSFQLDLRLRAVSSWALPHISSYFIIRPPGTAVLDGLMFYRRRFFLFRHAFSELPRPIALKLCHMVGIWLYFIIPLQKFGRRSPKKFGAKNIQNFGQFWTTSDFDREYLRNG